MALVGYYTAKVKISYVDYVVAKNYQNIINEWLKSTAVYTVPEYIKSIRKYSDYLRIILKHIILISIIYCLIKLVPYYVIENKLTSFAYFTIWSFLAVFFGYKMGDYLSYQFRLALTNYSDLTFIDLNAGDKKAIKNAKIARRNYVLKAIVSFILNVLISVAGTFIPKLF